MEHMLGLGWMSVSETYHTHPRPRPGSGFNDSEKTEVVVSDLCECTPCAWLTLTLQSLFIMKWCVCLAYTLCLKGIEVR